MKIPERISILTLVFSLCFAVAVFAQNTQPSGDMGNTAGSPTTSAPDQDQNQTGNTADQNSGESQNSNEGSVTPPAKQNEQPQDTMTASPATGTTGQMQEGKKTKVTGVIVTRNPDSLVVRTYDGGSTVVKLTDSTKYEEAKMNPFRGRRKYAVTQLVNGLPVEADGRGDGSGGLVARRIKFTKADYRVGQAVVSQAIPLQAGIDSNTTRIAGHETRISANEANAQRLSGQVEEVSGVASAARSDAKTAQQTADLGLNGLHIVNDRVSSVANFDVRDQAVIRFKVGSAKLSSEAMRQLDQLAAAAANEKAFIVQVTGFASSDGSESLNAALSDRRAEAVVHYLVIKHSIPPRHIMIPFGYGANNPVASNDTLTGREENRRAEVSILVNKGLSENPALPDHSSTNVPATGDTTPPR